MNIKIIDFDNETREFIKSLNYEWLNKYFHIEEGDIISLSNPQKEIIEKGGYIYYAALNNEIVGTVSLIKKENSLFELGKMAVTESAQGFGIGTILLEHCLKVVRDMQIHKLILYSNTQLESAIHLSSTRNSRNCTKSPWL